MSDVLPELIEPPANDLPIEAIEDVLRDHYGLSGQVFPIEGRQNPYFLIDNGHMRYLLKVAPAEGPFEEIEAEHALMRHILRSPDGPRVPEPVVTKDGSDTLVLPLGGEDRRIRLLTFLDGTAPPSGEKLPDQAIAAFGAISAALAKSLLDFEHPVLQREPEGDLRKAGPQTVTLLSAVADQEIRDVIAKAMVTALRRIQPLGPSLRIAAAHQNIDGETVVGEETDGAWLPTGVTDFTGISNGWLVAGFANTCAYLLADRDGDPFALLPAVRAYHDIYPFTLNELEALWPLVVARTGILSAEAESRQTASPDDPQARADAEKRRAVLDAATTVAPAQVFAAILDATGMEKPLPEIGRLLPDIDPETFRLVDLSVTSPLLYGGNWTDADNDWKLLAHIARETGRASTRYGEYRLSKSSTDPQQEPESFALHIDACIPARMPAVAPFAGTLKTAGPRLVLVGRDLTLHVEGLECVLAEDTELAAGDPLGVIAGADNSVGGLRLRFCLDPDLVPPLFCKPTEVGTWSRLCPSPSALLGIDANAPAPRYPDQPARGWREYLFDATGRSALDLTGQAPLIGYGHPRLAAATYRQTILLNRAAGHPSEAEEALRAQLAELAPEGLSHVYFTSGGAAALDLAFRLARGHTNKRGIIGLPGVRMDRRDPDFFAVPSVGTATDMIHDLDDVAAVLAQGYGEPANLDEPLTVLRQKAGLLIVDETGTGYGRLGHHTWGFSHRGLAPDIVFVDGPDGGAPSFLMTRPEIAANLPSDQHPPAICPVKAASAIAALDVIREEQMRENTREIGSHLKTRLESLAERFPAISAISGSGLLLVIDLADEAADLGERLRPGIVADISTPGRLVLRPPLCFSRQSADGLADRIEALLSEI
ncbi:aminotransferase class III-fold pyridoxal phosphate-dependent enzyme [Neorhizobium galegae]|uniref:aminotransferase class III-fold pyridoxal phosphate-dependent enzyme n=1 Tax=Neorhizobium galegae TaxID=399 RepID=UPI000622B28F|nr:aminotransferase class III-fold pyridoxal phosphate-dependent enzyme [Neorhizobium galegae]MCQ1780238.1 aminotransferase class III-fold pyridoxal phosphate-dependent enzyme [Neorhizobium galegae]MCQ1799111.1 aminotransferase class III-fold pyridoxal phosphate-dependent enzyme [Neorhizobium galegae]CDZ29891.1 4-aminobutyrate aminotransferase family protein [Neorhizobium galegae bv. officinalis]